MTLDKQAIRDYYIQDVGEVPPQIHHVLENLAEPFAGYMQMRQFVMGQDGDQAGALPKRYANLIFAVLDISTQNLKGAVNHARAALNAGLTWKELMQALVQLWIVCGFASTWGTVGWEVVKQLREEGFGPESGAENHNP